ncbi:hypothetical protein [Streptodolium elevatio]|uniref:Uncharacterized protein n=1 Tax=Streptodolium elevatio TaxID=3157996 RepID=A0ABV3DGQ9_9ACTN
MPVTPAAEDVELPYGYVMPEIPDDASDEDVAAILDRFPGQPGGGMSDEHARDLFAHLNARIADGEASSASPSFTTSTPSWGGGRHVSRRLPS